MPGTDESRSFSMANTPSRDGRFEFVIKVYPDGLFSDFLADEGAGRRPAGGRGPVRHLHPAESHDSRSVFVGGGAGMAPMLGLLRSMAERGVDREAVFYYGARRSADLCFEEELRALEERLSDFRYVPALSEPADDDDWDGEVGLITDVVARLRVGPEPSGRLRLRPAADGGCGDPDAHPPRGTRAATSSTTSSPPPVRPEVPERQGLMTTEGHRI